MMQHIRKCQQCFHCKQQQHNINYVAITQILRKSWINFIKEKHCTETQAVLFVRLDIFNVVMTLNIFVIWNSFI